MFPSTIIQSSNNDLIDQKVFHLCQQLNIKYSPHNPDILHISEDYSIENIRQIKNFLSQKPFQSPGKIILISHAQNLAPDAQNTLLKNLEDPGPNNYFILTTPKISSLIPTIISRCLIIRLGPQPKHQNKFQFDLPKNNKEAIDLSDQLSVNKENILPTLLQQLNHYHQSIIGSPSKKYSQTINKLIISIDMINNHIDPRFALDYFLLP